MKKYLVLLLLCLSLPAVAQTDGKYLAGAVTETDGRVTFTTEIDLPALTREQLYTTLLDWANKQFTPQEPFHARVLYTNSDEGSIAAAGEEYLVFTSNALSLDRTRIYYHFHINCEAGKCRLEMSRIRYLYDESRNGGQKYTAEEWITDDMALNKSKSKLAPICGKFRRKTIDLKDELFQSVQTALGNKLIAMGLQSAPVAPAAVVAQAQPAPQATPVAATPAPVATQPAATATADPDALVQAATRMTITAGNDEQFKVSKECWGGFGQLFGKQIASCLIDTQKTMANLLLSQSENYTIDFYLEGSTTPCLTVKCKKLTGKTVDGAEAVGINPGCQQDKSYNLYVGEVLSVEK